MTMLAENKWGIQLVEYIKVDEEDLHSSGYTPITGAFAVIKVGDKYLLGFNKWRGNWEFPAGKIEIGETPKDAAVRELYEETHQKVDKLIWKGLFKIFDKNKEEYRYRALYYGEKMELEAFVTTDEDEMERLLLWDMKEAIGYVDEVDIKMVELSCVKYDAIIFDVSDTLVEYSPNYAVIYGDRLRELGFVISDEKAKEISRIINWTICEQTRKEQCGQPHISKEELNALLDKAALSCVMNIDMCIKECLIHLSKLPIPGQKMTIIPDVTGVLDILKHKYRLAIVSNHYSWLMDYLCNVGLSTYFESIVISDIVGVSKPDIQIMQIALDELGLEAKQCLYVGDQPYDVLCSKQIGMGCAWINVDKIELPIGIPYKEDYRISNIIELLDIL